MLKPKKGLSDKLQVTQPRLQIRKPRPHEADLSKFTKYQVTLGVTFITNQKYLIVIIYNMLQQMTCDKLNTCPKALISEMVIVQIITSMAYEIYIEMLKDEENFKTKSEVRL